LRFTTPDDWRLRALLGGFWEDFRIKDDMNFLYKTIPSCTPANLAAALAPNGPACLSNVTPINAAIDPTQRNDNVAFGQDLERGYKQLAFFTSLDFDLIPKVLTLTGGTRWYRYTENEDGSQYKTSFARNCVNVPNGVCSAQAMDWAATYTGTRSRGNLTWHVTPDAMLYYTFSQGFRPGAFNRIQDPETKVFISTVTGQALPNGVPANGAKTVRQYVKPVGYPPDSLTNSEVGWKTEFFEHRLQINGSAYDMHWRDVQTLIYSPPVFGNTTFGVKGPDYEIKGFELSFIGRATTALSFQGSMSYNDSKETNSPCIQSAGKQSNPANPTPLGQCITQVKGKTVINGVSVSTNVPVINPLGAVGAVPAFSPKLEFNLRARYDWMINDMQAFFMVGGTHVDKMDNEPSSFTSGENVAVPFTTWLRYTQPAYNTYDASFGLSKGSWQAQIFGQNLSNSNASLFTSSAQFIRSEVPLRPRVLGLKVGFKF
jgi:iron complex outermembrane recepter protein